MGMWRSVVAVVMFISGGLLLRMRDGAPPWVPVIGAALLVAVSLFLFLQLRSQKDEVVRAANVAAMAWGAPIGLGLSFVTIFVVRFMPWAQDLAGTLAANTRNADQPAVVGFGMGVLFTCVVVVLCTKLVWAGWWAAKR